ncbi:condesin subunit F [Serratia liquefaciens]|nr:condesin subunit F [Serratia liquefaciens]
MIICVKKRQQHDSYAALLALETRYCRQEPYLSLGRYIHVTALKSQAHSRRCKDKVWSEFSQTVPELVAWARKNDFSISLPVDRLSFLLAIATLNGERLEGEMSEGELVDAFRHVSDAFEQTSETISQRANNAINDFGAPASAEPLYQRNYRRQCDLSPDAVGDWDHRLLYPSARILDAASLDAAVDRRRRAEARGGRRGRGR